MQCFLGYLFGINYSVSQNRKLHSHVKPLVFFEHDSHTLCKKKRRRTKKYTNMWKCVPRGMYDRDLHIMDNTVDGNPRILQAAAMFEHYQLIFNFFFSVRYVEDLNSREYNIIDCEIKCISIQSGHVSLKFWTRDGYEIWKFENISLYPANRNKLYS